MGCPPTLPAILLHGSWMEVVVSLVSCCSSVMATQVGQGAGVSGVFHGAQDGLGSAELQQDPCTPGTHRWSYAEEICPDTLTNSSCFPTAPHVLLFSLASTRFLPSCCPALLFHPSACWQLLSSLSSPSDSLLSFCQPWLFILLLNFGFGCFGVFLNVFFDPTDVRSDCLSAQHQVASR